MELAEDRFQHCVKEILEHEGGLTKDKRDPGGTTNWGISVRYLKNMGLDLNKDGIINDEDVIGLPVEGAIEIYREYWWNKYHYSAFNEIIVVEKVFDLAVNMGGLAAHKLLQKSINRLRKTPIVVDGLLGGKTIGAANACNPGLLREQLRVCALARYESILQEHPNMEWARKGWMRRGAW